MAVDHIGIIQTEYGGIQITLVQIPENKDYNNLEYGHFLRTVYSWVATCIFWVTYQPVFSRKIISRSQNLQGLPASLPHFNTHLPPALSLLLVNTHSFSQNYRSKLRLKQETFLQ